MRIIHVYLSSHMVTRFYDLQKRSQRLSNKLYSPCYSYSPGVWCINHTISALLFRSMAILLAIHEDDYSMSTLAIRKYFRCTLCFLPSVSFIFLRVSIKIETGSLFIFLMILEIFKRNNRQSHYIYVWRKLRQVKSQDYRKVNIFVNAKLTFSNFFILF